MKKNWFSALMVVVVMASLMMVSFAVAPAAQAKGIETRISLAGSPAFSAAKGTAKYKVDGANRELQVEAENLLAVAGKTVNIFVNGSKLGSTTVNSLGAARLKRSTETGAVVPVIVTGSKVEVKTTAGVLIVSGRF